ncbi:MAG: glycoside hydrolase family 43 protein [Candidatus Nealsonbacteria bacterium]|nr:glycoside hydrolase family 43 protein [Candidatus Nealsonbacteria bacterium]
MKRLFSMHLVLIVSVLAILPSAAPAAESASQKCYLLSYFLGNGEDGLRLAASDDGLHFTMATDRFLLKPEVGGKLMRDPSIVQAPDGTFQMVWTTSWNDRVIGYAHSKDLIHWSKQRTIPVMMHEPKARNCWAPEVFYDAATKRYVIVWSTTIPGRFPKTAETSESKYNHRMYYTTTRDFKEFAPTKLFYDPGYSVIDGFIAKEADRYLLFYKDERRYPEAKKVILLATADRAEGPYTVPAEPIVPHAWVEGPSAIKLADKWTVYFDCYTEQKYGAAVSKDLKSWTEITEQLKVPPGTRHGTVFEVDRKILDGLKGL